MKPQDLDKAILVPIPDTVACIVEMYWAPLSGRWVDRMVYPAMIRTIGNNPEAHMGSVASSFHQVPKFNDFKHISFYFIKYFSGTLKQGETGIRLIGMFDREEKLFYGINILYDFYALINKPRNFKVEPELTTINDFTDPTEEERRSRFFRFIKDQVDNGTICLLFYPEKLQFIS